MKITTWNVNGIRAVLGKGLLEWVQDYQPDVLCLQEVKARPEQVSPLAHSLPGYHGYWYPACRPGYSGVVTYTRHNPQAFDAGLGLPKFDEEGRIIRLRYPGFTLYNVYFPSGQRGHDRVEYKLEFYARLLDEIKNIHARGEQVIVTGDFNTAHTEIDLARPKQNIFTSGFLPEEREWIDIYLNHGLVDAFRKLYPDRRQYTWWTYRMGARQKNIGWRLDYFLLSESLMDQVQDVIVHEDISGSDHCPVTLVLEEETG